MEEVSLSSWDEVIRNNCLTSNGMGENIQRYWLGLQFCMAAMQECGLGDVDRDEEFRLAKQMYDMYTDEMWMKKDQKSYADLEEFVTFHLFVDVLPNGYGKEE